MGASKCCRRAGVLAFALSHAALAQAPAGAELTTLLDSGNLLGTEAADPAPWETLGSARSGRDNRARLTLTASEAGFVPGLVTWARLGLELVELGAESPARLRDLSSAAGFSWPVAAGSWISLVAYPLDSDYVRLGYVHALDWGGTHVARRESIFLDQHGGVPSLVAGLETSRVRLFVGAKWASADDVLTGPRRLWGGLGSGSVQLTSAWRADAGFGVFQRRTGFVEGASARLVWHQGASEPELSAEPFRPAPLRDEPLRLEAAAPLGWALALEGVLLVTRSPPRAAPVARSSRSAPAAALYGSARGRRLAGHAMLGWRSLAFVLRSDPRFSAVDDVPALAAPQAELLAWVGASFMLPFQLVPSLELGVSLPAALSTPSALPGVPQAWVARESTGLAPLPAGAARLPVVAARLGLRWQLSPGLGLSLSSDYQRDPNRARLDAAAQRVFAAPDSLAVIAAVQARM